MELAKALVFADFGLGFKLAGAKVTAFFSGVGVGLGGGITSVESCSSWVRRVFSIGWGGSFEAFL